MWRAAAPAVEWASANRPSRTVIEMPRLEFCLDRLHALSISGPGLTVALACLVAEEGVAATLAGHTARELFPTQAIVVGPLGVRCRGTGRASFRSGSVGHRSRA